MIPVLLGLGANLSFEGHSPLEQLGLACVCLSHFMDSIVFSSVYKTRAMYVTDQPDFYNMDVYGTVPDECTAESLLKYIGKIEEKLGRDREQEIRFGPRAMDIDIELFGDMVINTTDLTIPHPRLSERAFVLAPALEVLPKSTDCKERKLFAIYLHNLCGDGVQLFLPASEFQMNYAYGKEFNKEFDFVI